MTPGLDVLKVVISTIKLIHKNQEFIKFMKIGDVKSYCRCECQWCPWISYSVCYICPFGNERTYWLDVALEKMYCWENVSMKSKMIQDFSSVEFVNSFIIYSARVNAFRQGISLLCMFATHDKGFADKRSPVEWNFIQLIFCAVKMFRTMPSVGESESKPYLLFLLTFNPLSDNPTKWPNTLKQFVDKLHFWNFRRHLD